jgi:ElaA protein
MDWKCRDFKQLTTRELYSILRIRGNILVVEHAHIHLDLDGKDECARHVYALEPENGAYEVVAYARLFPGDDRDPMVTIDRFLMRENRRDEALHSQLLCRAIEASAAAWPDCGVQANLPLHSAHVYERCGFRKLAGPFLDQGVHYVSMALFPARRKIQDVG